MSEQCKHDRNSNVALGRFFTLRDSVLPEALKVALTQGLSIKRPLIQLTLDSVFDNAQAPKGIVTVRLQVSVPERPTYQTLKDFYHDLSGALTVEYMDKQSRGKFPNEMVLIDATHKTVVQLDEKTAKRVGAGRIELSMTYIEDVTSELRSALEVEVEQ